MKKSIYFQQARKITVNKLKTIKKFTLAFMILWIFLWSGFANIADPNDWPFWKGVTIFTITAIVLLGIISLGTFLMTLLLTLSKKKMPNLINSILGVTIGVILIKIGGIAIGTIFYLNDNRNPFPLNEQFTSSFIFLIPIVATILIVAYMGWTTNDSLISETC